MRIVLLGAPGSGKGTQAAILTEALAVPHISTGVLLRQAVADQTELGKQAQDIMERGELVPDPLMLALIKERLNQADAKPGFILDGYPRNLSQAEALDKVLDELAAPVEHAVFIDVDPEQIVARLEKRAELEKRSDDTPEVVRNRLRVYQQQTAPVVDYYRQQGKLHGLNGSGSIDEINARIMAALK